MSMSSKDSIEVAIRAAQIAKTVLGLMDPTSARLARFTLSEACKQIAELDNRLIEIGGEWTMPKEKPCLPNARNQGLAPQEKTDAK